MRVYANGAGRQGEAAWPASPREGAVFPVLSGSCGRQVETLAQAAAGREVTLLAHSWGAIPAVRALELGRVQAERLVLVEPALYDVARGEPAIEAHIETMSRARVHLDSGDLLAFWRIVRPLMFGGPVDDSDWEREQPTAERFAGIAPPWGHGVSAAVVASVPTLVVTGGWNEEYEAIAGALVVAGAEHTVLSGTGHRPQDDPRFEDLISRR